MFLSIEQVRAIVASFMELAVGEPVHLAISLKYRNADESERTVTGGYGLEGLWPEKETSSDVIPPETPLICAWCDDPVDTIGGVFCAGCQEKYDNSWYDHDSENEDNDE